MDNTGNEQYLYNEKDYILIHEFAGDKVKIFIHQPSATFDFNSDFKVWQKEVYPLGFDFSDFVILPKELKAADSAVRLVVKYVTYSIDKAEYSFDHIKAYDGFGNCLWNTKSGYWDQLEPNSACGVIGYKAGLIALSNVLDKLKGTWIPANDSSSVGINTNNQLVQSLSDRLDDMLNELNKRFPDSGDTENNNDRSLPADDVKVVEEKAFIVPKVNDILGVPHKHAPEPELLVEDNVVATDNDSECSSCDYGSTYLKECEIESLLALALDERIEQLSYTDYQEFFMDYPELVTTGELMELIENGDIYTQDNVILHNGEFIENENSEDFEDFEYQFDKDMKGK